MKKKNNEQAQFFLEVFPIKLILKKIMHIWADDVDINVNSSIRATVEWSKII